MLYLLEECADAVSCTSAYATYRSGPTHAAGLALFAAGSKPSGFLCSLPPPSRDRHQNLTFSALREISGSTAVVVTLLPHAVAGLVSAHLHTKAPMHTSQPRLPSPACPSPVLVPVTGHGGEPGIGSRPAAIRCCMPAPRCLTVVPRCSWSLRSRHCATCGITASR